MKIGVIYVGYNTEDYITGSLGPWCMARSGRGEYLPPEFPQSEFLICAVSVPFKGFDAPRTDGTLKVLYDHLIGGEIDHLITQDTPVTETAARGEALKWLVAQGVTHVWQVDSDEFYTVNQIGAIIRFIQSQPHIDWFRLCLRNAVFTPDQYLVEPFIPPRIHRISLQDGRFTAHAFNQDNDICYTGGITRDVKGQEQFASMTVPKEVAWICHASWLSDSRSKAKVAYQHKRWGHCSFRWNETEDKLEFDPEFFQKAGQPLPEIARDQA